LLTDPALVGAVLSGATIVVPAIGTDGWTAGVTAQRAGDGWALSGTQLAVAWAREASHAVVAARAEDGTDVLALVDLSTAALEDEVVSSHEPHATVTLDGARGVELATGPAALEDALARLTLLQCSYAVGVAEQSLHIAARHVSTREQFGKPLATFQTITYQVADCWIDVEAMRLTTQQAVWRLDQGLPSGEQTAIAAFWGAEGVQRVVGKAVHLHGGLGVDVSYPLHKWFLIGKVVELSLGGAQRSLERLGGLIAAR
jgi:alkylation response protein AidB-like acyl-CoA dehydrogenase